MDSVGPSAYLRETMKVLPILWQRLADPQGETCPRCAGTGSEIVRAVARLKSALAPLGIEPRLEIDAIDEQSFLQQPLTSNMILIAGRPIEAWLGASSGSSRCCGQCGNNECRTVELTGEAYEVIPEDLIVRAGMIAAEQVLGARSD